MKLHLQLQDSHSAYEWLKNQADKVGASGHIGTHIDCYTTTPPESINIAECVIINYNELSSIIFNELNLKNKALIIFSGNLEENGYGSEEYNNKNTSIDVLLLQDILKSKPKFILIDSHGIGSHGKQHIANDILCEKSNCFVIENVDIKKENLKSIKYIKIEIDINSKSTGKPCKIHVVN